MFDDLEPKKPAAREFPRNLDGMSVAELDEYIAELKAEIERVQGDIEAKKASQDAASSIFKS